MGNYRPEAVGQLWGSASKPNAQEDNWIACTPRFFHEANV
ncbi:hypothetical protein C4J87_3204 [Pseudomonas sp. R1-43-08]|nr:hypothetical protein C4J87_3204 [Pseudomonas sp. R1-43-08]